MLNHFVGAAELGNKSSLTRNLTALEPAHTPMNSFYPRCYLPKLPGQLEQFINDMCISVACAILRDDKHTASEIEIRTALSCCERFLEHQSPVLVSSTEWEVLFKKKHKLPKYPI